MYEVWNKLDLVEGATHEGLAAQAEARRDVFAVSALTGEGVPRLLDAISAAFDEEKIERVLDLPFTDGRRHAWLHGEGVVQHEVQTETGWQIKVLWSPRQERRWREL